MLNRVDNKFAQDTAVWAKRKKVGAVAKMRFSHTESNETKNWDLGSVADGLKAITTTKPWSLEFWVTEAGIQPVVWARDSGTLEAILALFRTLNPAITEEYPQEAFPPIQSGAYVRIRRMQQRRAASYPIRTEYGTRESGGVVSPIIHLLTNMPVVQRGSTIVVQFLSSKRSWPTWRRRPFSTFDPHIFSGTNGDATEAKRKTKATYRVEIRIVEIHTDPKVARVDHGKAIVNAFEVWDQSQCNRFIEKGVWFSWFLRRELRFLHRIQQRRYGISKPRLYRKPYFSPKEYASLVHPPPQGVKVRRLMDAPTAHETNSPRSITGLAVVDDEIEASIVERLTGKTTKPATEVRPLSLAEIRRMRGSK